MLLGYESNLLFTNRTAPTLLTGYANPNARVELLYRHINKVATYQHSVAWHKAIKPLKYNLMHMNRHRHRVWTQRQRRMQTQTWKRTWTHLQRNGYIHTHTHTHTHRDRDNVNIQSTSAQHPEDKDNILYIRVYQTTQKSVLSHFLSPK